MDADIIVKGRGEARSLPDRAVLTAVVDADGATREDAYRLAAESAGRADQVVQARSEAIARVVTAGLQVHPKTRWRKGESQRIGWRASRTTVLEVSSFDQLGDLIAELTFAGTTINGPTWQLDADSPAYREARRLAAADARTRAEDYAAALGEQLGPISWIAEPGLRLSGGHDGGDWAVPTSAMMRGGGGFAGEAEEIISVEPEELTTVATVEVGFRFARG